MQLLIQCLWLLCLGTLCLTNPLDSPGNIAEISGLEDSGASSNIEECSVCPLSTCEDEMYGDCDEDPPDDPDDPDITLQLLSGRNEPDASELDSVFGGRRTYRVGTPLLDCSFEIKSRAYPSSGKLFKMTGRSKIEKVLRLQSQCCSDTNIELLDKTLFSKNDISEAYATEHIEELQFAISFLQSAASGILPSGKPMRNPKMSCQVLKKAFAADSTADIGWWKIRDSNKRLNRPADLLFEAFGSSTLTAPLVLLEKGVNTWKSRCFSYNRAEPGNKDSGFALSKPHVVDFQKFEKALIHSIQTGRDEDKVLQPIRESIGAWKYIHQKDVAIQTANTRGRLSQVVKYVALDPKLKELKDIREAFREIETDWWDHAVRHCSTDVHYLIDLVEEHYKESIAKGVVPANWPNVEQALSLFRADMSANAIRVPIPPVDF